MGQILSPAAATPSTVCDLDALVRHAQQGDRRAYDRLLARLRPTLRRVVRRAFGLHSADLDDIVQDALLRIHRALPCFDLARGVRFATWCSVIALNHCRDFLRRRRLQAAALPDDRSELALEDPRPQPFDSAVHIETLQIYREALSNLPPQHREVFELRTEHALSYDEIAARVGVSPGTVKSRLHRARRLLHDSILEPDAA